jgi:hypothetical protein
MHKDGRDMRQVSCQDIREDLVSHKHGLCCREPFAGQRMRKRKRCWLHRMVDDGRAKLFCRPLDICPMEVVRDEAGRKADLMRLCEPGSNRWFDAHR